MNLNRYRKEGYKMSDNFQALMDFKYGDVSDPKPIIKGNIYSTRNFPKHQLDHWEKLGWIKMVQLDVTPQ